MRFFDSTAGVSFETYVIVKSNRCSEIKITQKDQWLECYVLVKDQSTIFLECLVDDRHGAYHINLIVDGVVRDSKIFKGLRTAPTPLNILFTKANYISKSSTMHTASMIARLPDGGAAPIICAYTHIS